MQPEKLVRCYHLIVEQYRQPPLRLLTRIAVAVGGGVSRKASSCCCASFVALATAVSGWVTCVPPCVMHAAALPSGAAQASDQQDGQAASQRPRRHGQAMGGIRSTSPLPPEIPRPAPRAVLRAAVGRSSDSWTRKLCFLLGRCFPVPVHQCVSRLRFHLPLRGSAGMGSCEPHRLPFSSDGVGQRNRRPQHSVVS